jgi:predicted RNase H-like HicB family nuclease
VTRIVARYELATDDLGTVDAFGDRLMDALLDAPGITDQGIGVSMSDRSLEVELTSDDPGTAMGLLAEIIQQAGPAGVLVASSPQNVETGNTPPAKPTDNPLDLTVRYNEDDDGFWWAHVLQLPGCFAAGDSRSELDESLQRAIGAYLGVTVTNIQQVASEDGEAHVLASV